MIAWSDIGFMLLLVIAGAALCAMPILRGYNLQLKRRAEARDSFFEYAHKVLHDPSGAPESVLKRLEFYSHTITWKIITWYLLWDMISGKLKRTPAETDEDVRDADALSRLSLQSRLALLKATHAWFRAVTFNNPIAGEFARQIIGSTLKKNVKATQREAEHLREQICSEQRSSDQKLAA